MTNVFSCIQSREALSLMTEHLALLVERKKNAPFSLGLSGGGTAQQLFTLWTEQFFHKIAWDTIRFYWVDERCVAPDDNESNFGHARDLLFDKLGIPPEHIHRIRGETDPAKEADRYAKEVENNVPCENGIPRFDAIILGAGGDGHTASIFPNTMHLLSDAGLYAVSEHPQTGQKRITMTGPLILNAAALLLPIVGSDKTGIVRELLTESDRRLSLPAGYVIAHAPHISVYTNVTLAPDIKF